MKRSKLNFFIDALAYIAFVFISTTGILMRYVLPPGSGHVRTIWGLDRHAWGDIHFWVSVGFLAILALHLIYHWKWIVYVIKGKSTEKQRNRVALGIFGAIGLLFLALLPVISPVEVSGEGGGQGRKGRTEIHEGQNQHESHENENIIRGSMTLGEVEAQTGVPVSYILDKLDLPSKISKSARLGQLKKDYGFDMHHLREIVDNYQKDN